MNKVLAAGLAATPVIAAQLVGSQFGPTPDNPSTALWYSRLRKPWFTPPGPIFGVAWTILDSLLGYAGYRVLIAPVSWTRKVALLPWALTVLGVAGHSWAMFGRKRLDHATLITAGMGVSAIGAVITANQVDRRAAWAGVPLVAWLAFAFLLQEEVWRRNR